MADLTRRHFLTHTLPQVAGWSAAAAALSSQLMAQSAGERPKRAEGIQAVLPRNRVPVGMIIDDSTCLVNLNRFAMPQFDEAFAHEAAVYHRPWQEWPVEIPDAFVRKFGEWCHDHGVKGKYSIVPYPACVGRLDRMLPGWTQTQLRESLDLVRTLMVPNWDIHPEMTTHTRVIDLKTGHPYADHSLRFMENWEWTTGRGADEIGEYMAYALRILKNVGLPCEGITTPGGFGNKALPQLAQGTLRAVKEVYGAEIPHYFRHLYSEGDESVAPRVEYASGLDGGQPQCVVSIIGCAGDWTGGWDNTPPGGVDKFISSDLKQGRMVDVISRGEPALMLGHWTGIYWNGQELGFTIFKEVVRRLSQRFDNLVWMKLSEVARYWAAKELTTLLREPTQLKFKAPFACPDFTIRCFQLQILEARMEDGAPLKQVSDSLKLLPGTWCTDGKDTLVCFALAKGSSSIHFKV